MIDFGLITSSDTVATMDLVIRNDGDLKLSIAALQMAGTQAEAFSFYIVGDPAGNTGLVLAAGEQKTIRIHVDPTRFAGPVEAELRFVHGDATQTSPFFAILRAEVEGPLPGDLDRDLTVGIDDLTRLLNHWGDQVAPGDLASGDISGPNGRPDGKVDIEDLTMLLNHWGESGVGQQQAQGTRNQTWAALPGLLMTRWHGWHVVSSGPMQPAQPYSADSDEWAPDQAGTMIG